MERRFDFGKIDYNGIGRKVNRVTVDVEWDGAVFSASGAIWNARGTDCIVSGQMLDDPIVNESVDDDLYRAIREMWGKNHLNDLHAGTYRQTEALERAGLTRASDYYEACKYLDDIGLLYDEWDGGSYKYGSGWLTWPVDEGDVETIERIMAS